jgi:hypothetical protein
MNPKKRENLIIVIALLAVTIILAVLLWKFITINNNTVVEISIIDTYSVIEPGSSSADCGIIILGKGNARALVNTGAVADLLYVEQKYPGHSIRTLNWFEIRAGDTLDYYTNYRGYYFDVYDTLYRKIGWIGYFN